jgi:hypothetical protein
MLYVWEILKQFFQAVLLLYSKAFIVAGTMWYGSATTPIELFVRLVTNGTLDSSNKKLINEFKLA